MKAKILAISLIAILALLLSGPATAQGPQPPAPPYPTREPGLPPGAPPWELESKPFGPFRTPEGHWFMPEGARPPMEAVGISPQATGGPDDFGYTWDDSVPFNWIDVTGGIDTGLTSNCQNLAAVPIGFPFKFYENTYSTVYVSLNGYLAFDAGSGCYWHGQVPSPATPNNIIAPYWGHFTNVAGHVRYLQGGSIPNRYLVIEWHQMTDQHGAATYTFEVILHENGDIVFQYQTMNYSGGWSCAGTGIEDSTGTDGLMYQWCSQIGNNKAIRFYHPAPSARVRVYPLYQGRFTRAGATESFQVPIRNTGELGADTYDLSVSSSWLVSLYAADGTTPLTDTDGDGAVDTGPVAQGGTFTVTVKVQTPAVVNVGDDNSAVITIRSSLDTGKSKTVALQTAVPAPFAQVYRDDADGAMSLYLVQPGGQAVKKATPDWYYGYNTAVAEAPNGNFIYAWYKGRCLDSNCNVYVTEIEYALLDRYGNVVRPVSKLTDHTGATMDTYDYSPAVAIAPNGRIGVLWTQGLWNSSTNQSNFNIYFAILDASGNRVYGPVNLTNNNVWGDPWSDLNVPWLYSPRIAATGDNHFVLAWQREHQESGGWVEDIYYTVRDANGGIIKDVTRFTYDTPGWDDGHNGINLSPLANNRVIMTWFRSGANGGVYFAVFDSSGNIVKGMTNLGMDGSGVWYDSTDVVQLPNGRIVVAWVKNLRVRFAILDSAYNPIVWYRELPNPSAPTGDLDISVTADSANHAILTWMDSDWSYRRNLYYALVDSNGNVLTPPMIFRTAGISPWGGQYIETSFEGYGNTSYSWTPPSGVDGVAAFSASLFGGPPGGNAAVGVRYANRGTTIATGVVLTATLDSNLTYVSDTSGVVPTVSGNKVVWNLPDLGFLESRGFTLYVRVPSGAGYGTRYPITLTLTSAGSEANPSDNTASAQVMAARQVFLPLVLRNR
jgi:hypothetical protein